MKPQTVSQMWDVPGMLFNPIMVSALALVMRISFFLWGLYQDAHMIPRFTDIDYYVFTDAANYVASGNSPYERATYRYTPLLAWMLVPTAYGKVWFSFGKFLFMLGDMLAGWLIIDILRRRGATKREASVYASIWLLNPMVCVISARGSSEGFLGAVVVAMIWLVNNDWMLWGGMVAGFAIHLKIYPMIYVPTIYWAAGSSKLTFASVFGYKRFKFIMGTLLSFLAFTGWMYHVYGQEYIDESWLYHLTRMDHRHNFSYLSTALYYNLAFPDQPPRLERLAFVPQLLLCLIVLPLMLGRKRPLETMFLQTFTFVTFNKVCTSQYFVWYIVLLPFCMSSLSQAGKIKYVFATLWVLTQASWLHYAYQLEFLGKSVFFPQLFASTISFFLANVWGICLLVRWFSIPSRSQAEACAYAGDDEFPKAKVQ